MVFATNMNTNKDCALKVIAKNSIETMKYSEHIISELRVMHFLKQFNFVGFVQIRS